MNQVSFLEVSNNGSDYSSLFARYSNIEVALTQLKKSNLLRSCIAWENEHKLTVDSFDKVFILWEKDSSPVKEVTFEYTPKENKIYYKAKLKVSVYKTRLTPEVKEEGLPYQPSKEEKFDESTRWINVEGYLVVNKVSINLDGIPTIRGELLDEDGKTVEQEERS